MNHILTSLAYSLYLTSNSIRVVMHLSLSTNTDAGEITVCTRADRRSFSSKTVYCLTISECKSVVVILLPTHSICYLRSYL